MVLVHALLKNCMHFVLGFLLMQMSAGLPPDSGEANPMARATTPPDQFVTFAKDFASLDKGRFMEWINPNRGLVKNGLLLSKDEADADFHNGQSDSSGVQEVNVRFNYGEFAGGNTFQGDSWVEYKGKDQDTGEVKWFRFHNIFVFEIIDGVWYLVQSEYVRPDPGITMQLESGINQAQNVPPELQKFVVSQTTPALPGVTPWPLLIGSNFAGTSELHPLQGTKWDGTIWTLAGAVAEHKPTVFYFFAPKQQLLFAPTDEEFKGQMDFLAGLYTTFGISDLYIFAVTDEPRDNVDWLANSGYNQFAPLLDDHSNIHAALNIDIHPYIVVLDASGTVVATCKTYHPGSFDMIRDRIRDAVASAKTTGH